MKYFHGRPGISLSLSLSLSRTRVRSKVCSGVASTRENRIETDKKLLYYQLRFSDVIRISYPIATSNSIFNISLATNLLAFVNFAEFIETFI